MTELANLRKQLGVAPTTESDPFGAPPLTNLAQSLGIPDLDRRKELFREAWKVARNASSMNANFMGSLSPDERNRFFLYAAAAVPPAGRKDWVDKLATRIGRGVSDRLVKPLRDSLTRAVLFADEWSPWGVRNKLEGAVGRLKYKIGQGPMPSDYRGSSDIRDAQYEIGANERRMDQVRAAVNPAKGGNWLSEFVLGAAEMAPAMAGTAGAEALGGPMGALAYWTALIEPTAYDQFKQRGWDEKSARLGAVLSAVPQAAIERMQFRQLLPTSLVGPVRDTVARTTWQWLAQQGKRELLITGKEISEEGLQSLTDSVVAAVGSKFSDQLPGVDWETEFRSALDQMYQAAGPIAVMRVPGAAVDTSNNARTFLRQRLARQVTSALEAQGGDVEHPALDKAALLTPEGARQFVRENPELAEKLAGTDEPTRRDFENVPGNDRWSKAERQEFAGLLQQFVQQAPSQAAEGVEDPARPESRAEPETPQPAPNAATERAVPEFSDEDLAGLGDAELDELHRQVALWGEEEFNGGADPEHLSQFDAALYRIEGEMEQRSSRSRQSTSAPEGPVNVGDLSWDDLKAEARKIGVRVGGRRRGDIENDVRLTGAYGIWSAAIERGATPDEAAGLVGQRYSDEGLERRLRHFHQIVTATEGDPVDMAGLPADVRSAALAEARETAQTLGMEDRLDAALQHVETGEAGSIIGFRTRVDSGLSVREPQRGAGVYVALDGPYRPDSGQVSRVSVALDRSKILDPNGLLEGTNQEQSKRDLQASVDEASHGGRTALREALVRRGYEAEVGLIGDDESGARELVVWDASRVEAGDEVATEVATESEAEPQPDEISALAWNDLKARAKDNGLSLRAKRVDLEQQVRDAETGVTDEDPNAPEWVLDERDRLRTRLEKGGELSEAEQARHPVLAEVQRRLIDDGADYGSRVVSYLKDTAANAPILVDEPGHLEDAGHINEQGQYRNAWFTMFFTGDRERATWGGNERTGFDVIKHEMVREVPELRQYVDPDSTQAEEQFFEWARNVYKSRAQTVADLERDVATEEEGMRQMVEEQERQAAEAPEPPRQFDTRTGDESTPADEFQQIFQREPTPEELDRLESGEATVSDLIDEERVPDDVVDEVFDLPIGEPQPGEVSDSWIAPFAVQEPEAETPGGGKLLDALRADQDSPRASRVGMRSIVGYVNNLMHADLMVGKTQLGSKNPAFFQVQPALIRSRSGTWHLNFHEAGHALSYWLHDANRQWWAQMHAGLTALTQMRGSMASAKNVEEGVAEFVRRYITDYGSLPELLRRQMEGVLQELCPEVLAGMRDAHRAYAFQQTRPALDQIQAYKNDKPKAKRPERMGGDVMYRLLHNVIGGAPVLHRMNRWAFARIAGEGGWAKLDVTGAVGAIRSKMNAAYDSSLKLAQAFTDQVTDNPADTQSAYQMLLHVSQEVQRVMGGVGSGLEGIRLLAFGSGIDQFSDEQKDALQAAGFRLPEGAPHGNWLYLGGQSISAIKHAIGRENWDAFEAYGQYRAALYRYDVKGHEYPGMTEGLGPESLRSWLAEQERQNPDWDRHFKSINDFMNQLVLVPVLSGELSVEDAVRIVGSWEDYWPLPRQVEDRGTKRSGYGPEPDSGIRRAFGSSLPFVGIDQAIESRVKMALEAYYTNCFYKAMRNWSRTLGAFEGADYDTRKEGERIMIRLRPEVRPAATLGEDEERKVVADDINAMTAKAKGVTVEELDPDTELVKPADVVISRPGRKLWRAQKPNAVHVITLFEDGERKYYQIPDPLVFDLMSRGSQPNKHIAAVGSILSEITQPWKEALTQNIVFALWNTLSRDLSMAGFMGEEFQSLIPGYYAAVGLVNRFKGERGNLNAIAEGERLSNSLNVVSTDAHRDMVERFMDMLKEGMVPEGYGDMTVSDKLRHLPGQFMWAVTKPIHVFNWLHGGRWISQFGEKLSREGAYISAVKRGYSPARAQIAYDYVTGNFGQKAGSANVAALVRSAGFLNPAIQIMWGQTQRMTDPNPANRAFYWTLKVPALAMWGSVGAALNFMIVRAMHPNPDDLEDVLEQMRERPVQDRLGYMAVGGKIRLPFDYGLVGAAVSYGWNTVEEWLLEDPIKAADKAKILLNRARDLPGITDVIQPYIKTGMELYRNHSYFYDDEIVPAWLEAVYPYNPELQTWPNMPSIYDAIGRKLKVSPIKLRYGVRQVFTRQMDDIIGLASGAEYREPADYPLLGRMLQRSSRGWRSQGVQSVADLDQQYQAFQQRLKDVRKKARSGDLSRERAETAIRDLNNRARKLATAHQAMLAVERLWRRAKDERNKPSPNHELIKQIETRMTRTARSFLERERKRQGGVQ